MLKSYRKQGLPYFYLIAFARWLPKRLKSKVLIFFMVTLDKNLISPIKSAYYEGIYLIKTLIKNINSQPSHKILFHKDNRLGL